MADRRVLTLIGDPVAESLSPTIHNAALAHLELAACYVTRRVGPEIVDLEPLVRQLASQGGGNVTVPLKARVASVIDRPSELVSMLGVCNCFWEVEPGVVGAENTDVGAIEAALGPWLRWNTPRSALILGAGGAAAASAAALGRLGFPRVTIRNRSGARARTLAARMRQLGFPVEAEVDSEPQPVDLIVNATSLGMRADDPLPMPLAPGSASLVLDLVYRDGPTDWLAAAVAADIETVDGREVLLHQAAAGYPLWFDLPAPVSVMRAALYGN